MLLTLLGTFSVLACYNHVNKVDCPNTYTNGNGGTCTLVTTGQYDDPNDDGTGAKGKDSVKDKGSSARDCQYNCDGDADSIYNYVKTSDGKDCGGGA